MARQALVTWQTLTTALDLIKTLVDDLRGQGAQMVLTVKIALVYFI
jgi:hypothetical protein